MDNHPDSEQILAFSRRAMNPEEMLRIDRHMEACASCRDRWASLRNEAIADPLPARKPRHLNYQQMKAMVQNSAVPEAGPELEEHLRSCAGCRNEIDELRRFAAMLAEPEMPARREPEPRSAGWRAWFAAPVWNWAAAAALVVILAGGVAELAPVTRTLSAQLAGAERISDDGFGYMVDSRGNVLGWRELPDTYRRAIRAVVNGEQPSGEIGLQDAQKRFGSSHLIVGVAYWQAGIMDQARAEFEQLKLANPQASLVDRLLDSCKRR